MPKRPPPTTLNASSSSNTTFPTPSKRPRQILSGLKIFIIQAKLSASDVGELYHLAEDLGANVDGNIYESDVIVSVISMKARLERHIPWEKAKRKAIVTPQWLRLSSEKEERLPFAEYAALKTLAPPLSSKPPSTATATATPPYTPPLSPSPSSPPPPPTKPPTQTHGLLSSNPHSTYSCQRLTPLISPNQGLCKELAVIMRQRWLDGEYRSELSYSRGIAVLKAYPRIITSADEVKDVPGLGPKFLRLIEEYLSTSQIEEAQKNLSNKRFQTLVLFTSIHGIGPQTARQLYDHFNCRSFEDLERYYLRVRRKSRFKKLSARRGKEGDGSSDSAGEEDGELGEGDVIVGEGDEGEKEREVSGTVEALELREDLAIQIPREEVEEIARVIHSHLERIEPGFVYTICGGYRRGKPQSNDVDIIWSHPKAGTERGACERLVNSLMEAGIVMNLLYMSSFASDHSPFTKRRYFGKGTPSNWDSLDKALTIIRLPEGSGIHRRVDLIFASTVNYWTAVVGWTGSKQFERDIRLWAQKEKGLKFDSSGITRRRDTKPVIAHSEQEVFDILGLKYIEPQWRNADL